MDTIISRIKHLRKNLLHLSQEDFGKSIGLSKSNISNIEVGRINLTDRVVISICEKFNVNEIWLKTGEGDPFDELPEMNEESAYIESLMMEKDDEFIDAVKALLKVYCKMDDLSKKVFKQAVKDWIAEMNKGAD